MAGRCNASQDAQDAWDAGDASLASGRNADGSDAGSVFADGCMSNFTTPAYPSSTATARGVWRHLRSGVLRLLPMRVVFDHIWCLKC